MSTQPQTTTAPTIDQLATELEDLRDRVAELETENERLREENADLKERVADLETDHEATRARFDAATDLNDDRLNELMARELEKGAHLPSDIIVEFDLPIKDARLEKVQKDDGEYYRLPEAEDPLGRGGSTTLAHGDLLPIQQLARMDDDMLHSSTSDLPSRLAAKLWKARTDPNVGDNPWRKGSKGVREYVKASDMKSWIRRVENGVSSEYAKKLVSRTIDRLLEFSNNRLGVKKKTQRKNGLSYKERFVELREDVEIPGESGGSAAQQDTPKTDGVLG